MNARIPICDWFTRHHGLYLSTRPFNIHENPSIPYSVSHHPPMGSAHAENERFIYDISSKVKTNFLENSMEIYPLKVLQSLKVSYNPVHCRLRASMDKVLSLYICLLSVLFHLMFCKA